MSPPIFLNALAGSDRCRSRAKGAAMAIADGKALSVKQQWIISGDCSTVPDPGPNCRMTAPRGKGSLLVAHNDERLLVGFKKEWEAKGGAPSTYIIFEKNTGLYMDINDIVASAMGPAYKDSVTPSVQLGHCRLSEIVPIKKKK